MSGGDALPQPRLGQRRGAAAGTFLIWHLPNLIAFLIWQVRLLARREGVTPLHVAAACGNHQLCATLVEWGADVEVQDANGMLPGDFARARANCSLCLRIGVIYCCLRF